MVSSILNVAYLMPIVARGFFRPSDSAEESDGIKEAPVFCVVPLCISALGCIALFFFADDLYNLLLPLAGEVK
jgi:multicomponent Na+:H+ antiporter subunit D